MERDKNLLPQCCQQHIAKFYAPIAIPIITFVAILFLGNILITNTSKLDIEVKAIQRRLTKLSNDLVELKNAGNHTWAWKQYQRKEHVRKVCQKYENPKQFQQVKSFIMDPKVRGKSLLFA